MRHLLKMAFALLFSAVITGVATGQSLNGPFEIRSDSTRTYTHQSTDAYQYIVYSAYVPSGSIGILGFHRTRGSGNNDIRVGTSVRANGSRRASIGNIQAIDTSSDFSGDVLVFAGDGFAADTFYIEAWSVDDRPGEWALRYTTFNVGEAFGEAIVSAGFEWLVVCALMESCNRNQSDAEQNIGRALDLGVSLATRDNVCAVGTDFIVSEVRNQLVQEMGGQSYATMVLVAMLRNFVGEVAWTQCL